MNQRNRKNLAQINKKDLAQGGVPQPKRLTRKFSSRIQNFVFLFFFYRKCHTEYTGYNTKTIFPS